MTAIYCSRWVLPISSAPLADGAIAVEAERIIAVGRSASLVARFPRATLNELGDAAILPGLVNTHSHLELTALRGFLEAEEGEFFAWLRKLTIARSERMTADDLYVSAAWGACEAARAGITSLGDASDAAGESLKALRDTGLRGTVFKESFGPDPKLARENFDKLRDAVAQLRESETPLVRLGISPHAPYTVCAPQLQMIAEFALAENLSLMMHAAESAEEELFIREGRGLFAENLAKRGIEWQASGLSTIQYLERNGVLRTRPLLAHCIRVDHDDLGLIKDNQACIAHCPKSNAKLGHGRAPLTAFLDKGITVGLGSDSVASNNTCDLLEEARFALLLARTSARSANDHPFASADAALGAATLGGAQALGLGGKIGELKEGYQADFIVVSLGGAHQLPDYEPAATLVFSSSGRDVMLTVVAGREVYRNGRVLTVDEDRLRARIEEIAKKLRS